MKSKWIRLQVQLGFRKVLTLLSDTPFSDEHGSGFEVLELENNTVRLKFCERHVDREEVIDPFGAVNEMQTIRYAFLVFNLKQQGSGLFSIELLNPPRSIKRLITDLRETLGDITVTEVLFDPLLLYSEWVKTNSSGRVRKLRATNLFLSAQSSAKVEISSNHDALIEFRKAFSNMECVIDRLYIEDVSGSECYLDVYRSGLVAYDQTKVCDIRAFFEHYFSTTNFFQPEE
ncbi:MAG TPA: hypothetical protein VGK09_03030 [Rhodocyclaceae bacterium]|jgi:hypothetical protein